MNYGTGLCVFFFSLPLVSLHSSSRSCSYRQHGRYVKIPDLKSLLTLDEFDEFVVDTLLLELTIGTPNPVPFVLFRNFNMIHGKTAEGQYTRYATGNPVTNETTCVEDERELHPANEHCDKAAFYNETSPVLIPALPGPDQSPDDIPWSKITEDVHKATGIKVGSKSLPWFHTFGLTKNC